ncbi:MAG: molybdopterin molybdotransferase MoeA [Nitrospirae bacterium]|nr:molybdopterin molybdotransferase MoeA [Nitrospirota bacterium]
MISVKEALKTILANITISGTEKVNIMDSLGRVLAEDIVAKRDHPPWDNSAMDGYAVIFSDIRGASKKVPSAIKVIGEVPAGRMPAVKIGRGEAVKIMTGAPMPEGADTVVRVEDTESTGSMVSIFKECESGENIRRRGEDVKNGDLVIEKGKKIRPAEIGMIASVGRAFIYVHQRPRVAVMSTGDEIADLDEELSPEKIINSNSYALRSLAMDAGCIPALLGIARDNKEDLTRRLRDGLTSDVILISGGVSMGDYDFVKDVLAEMGMEMKFWKVSMKPGQPLAFGTIKGKPVFGLPGNPVSAMVSFYQFVMPALKKMGGQKALYLNTIDALSDENLEVKKGRTYFIRAVIDVRGGVYHARSTGDQGSGILTSMVRANGLIVIPEDSGPVKAGDKVKVQLIGSLSQEGLGF